MIKNTILLIYAFMTVGCASTQYSSPKNGPTAVIEFVADYDTTAPGSTQVLAFKSGCDKHPRGVFVGKMCAAPGCRGMAFDERFDATIPLTLRFEFKSDDARTGRLHRCNNQFTFTPEAGVNYRASLQVNDNGCQAVVQQKTADNRWIIDNAVKFDQNMCHW